MLQNFQENVFNQPQLPSHERASFVNMASNTLFYLEDVSVDYGTIKALKSVQLAVDKGEIVFITGVSGAGKTTLLRMLAGENIPYTGKVQLPNDGSKKKVFISRVFQDLRLSVSDTCESNLRTAYDSNLYPTKNEFNQDMMELSRILGFKDRLQLKIQDANGGLKQKVAITRALLGQPDVFIADEPTSSLDFDNAKKIFDILNLYNAKRGMTVIWASHNSELIKKFTGRIVHLDNGRLVYSGHACFI